MSALPLTQPVFAILSTLIEERLGIHYEYVDAGVLADKVTPRALERGFDSLLDYYYYLRYDDSSAQEFDALAEALVVNETYFFREADQLETLVKILGERDRPARVWCAAAATGEEPYTFAMMLHRSGLLPRTEIIASDISARALGRAREGVYKGRSLRSLSEVMRERYFHEENGMVRVDDKIKNAVSFRTINLLDDVTISALGSFDAILCRNVFIYFRDDGVARIADRLTQRLVIGGYLLVGAAESLLRFSTALNCVELKGTFLYQRVEP